MTIMLIIIITSTILIIATHITFFKMSSREYKKIINSLEAPLLEIIMRNFLINEPEIKKLKKAYSKLDEQSQDEFQDAILNLRILQHNWKASPEINPIQQMFTPSIALIALMIPISLNVLSDLQDMKMKILASTSYFSVVFLVLLYLLYILQNRFNTHRRKITKLINTHLIIAEEVLKSRNNNK